MPLLHLSAILRNMVGYRIFHMKILTLRTNKTSNFQSLGLCTCRYAWFLSSIADEVGNQFLRLQVQRVLGSLLNDSICLFEVILVRTIDHSRPLWSSLDQRRDFALFWGAAHAWIISNKHMLSLRCDPKTHVALAILKMDFRPRQQCQKETTHTGTYTIPSSRNQIFCLSLMSKSSYEKFDTHHQDHVRTDMYGRTNSMLCRGPLKIPC